ncbi:MAG TPA: 16S rRNA (cytosine(1402)-N(4))-methyltransferase RsmH [Rhizobiales bacterium]|nr:ribosomal RNA small subunit methyltransferase H [bacterium BMS3Bbin10]HDO52944.1 16S rRNA (cytosine(1402)-N(4))-methyltransferase RsmH [Hyphomicrobiales bacterium]
MTSRGTPVTGAAGGPVRHVPVLLPEIIDALAPRENGTYIDGTFGAGGYTRALLESAECIVLAIDKDPEAISAGRGLEAESGGRLTLVQGAFGDMADIAAANGISRADGIALDLGVSSMQLDQGMRGFSFQSDGPLDMRMSQAGPSAADAVNSLAERDLARVIRVLGEERRARAIARAIVAAREERPIARTGELADIVTRVLGRRHDDKKHPATRTFQALRLYVNGELDELVAGLLAAERLLGEGGRLVVVTFHSLEDRIVKRFLAARAGKAARPSRHAPVSAAPERQPSFALLHRRAVTPGADEIKRNPRARSARMRAGVRMGTPPFPAEAEGLGVPKLSVNSM